MGEMYARARKTWAHFCNFLNQFRKCGPSILLIALALFTNISPVETSVQREGAVQNAIQSDPENHIRVGEVKLHLKDTGFPLYMRKQSFSVSANEGLSGRTNENRRVVFKARLNAKDSTQFHGADYYARIQLYKGRLAGDWVFIDEAVWTHSTNNEDQFTRDEWSTLEVSDYLGQYEPQAYYCIELKGRLGQSGSGTDEDNHWAFDVLVINEGLEDYQQVCHINSISDKQLGEQFTASGWIDTIDGYGEPISNTKVNVRFYVGDSLEDSKTPTTDSNGDWSTTFKVPVGDWALANIGKVEAYDSPKDTSYYKADPNGDYTTFDFYCVEKKIPEVSVEPVLTSNTTPGNSAEYNVLVTLFNYPGGGTSTVVDLNVIDLPPFSSASFSQDPVTVEPNNTVASLMTITTDPGTPIGRYEPTITATAGTLVSRVKCILKVREKIKIGLIGPFGLQFWSPSGMKEAAELAVELLNIDSDYYEFELVFGDEHAFPSPDPGAAAFEMDYLINGAGCDFIVGGFRSDTTDAMIEVAMDYATPFVIVGALADNLIADRVPIDYARYKYLFRTYPNATTHLRVLVSSLVEYLIPTRLLKLFGHYLWEDAPNPQVRTAILTEDLPWTSTTHAYLSNPSIYPSILGPYVNVTYEALIPEGTTDFTPWLENVNSSDARLLIHTFPSGSGMYLISQWGALNIDAIPVGLNIFGHTDTYWTNLAGECEYETILSFAGNRTPIAPRTVAFWDEFLSATGYWPSYTAIAAYDAIIMIGTALELIEIKDNDLLVSHLEQKERPSLTGRFGFESSHDLNSTEFGSSWTLGHVRPFMVQWFSETLEPVFPTDQLYSKRWEIPPWMYPLLEDLNYDGKVDIKDVALAAKAFGTVPGDPRWEKEADISRDDKIDIRDIAQVARAFGQVISLPLP